MCSFWFDRIDVKLEGEMSNCWQADLQFLYISDQCIFNQIRLTSTGSYILFWFFSELSKRLSCATYYVPDQGLHGKPHHSGEQEEWCDQDVEESQRGECLGWSQLVVRFADVGVSNKGLKENITLSSNYSDKVIHLTNILSYDIHMKTIWI